jgi:hypothetical protein
MKVWRLAPFCLMWCLWQERNSRDFENVDFSDRVAEDYVQHFYTWISARHKLLVSSFADFLNVCSYVKTQMHTKLESRYVQSKHVSFCILTCWIYVKTLNNWVLTASPIIY